MRARVWRRLAVATTVATLLIAATAGSAQPLPQTAPLDTWGPAGVVSAVARKGDTLYVGGAFEYVGPGTGPFAAFALDTPRAAVVARDFDGSIEHILRMPDGGWVVSGQIRSGPSAVSQLARVTPDGRIDARFFASVQGTVEALDTDGTRLFVGGFFAAINGTPRPGLAALDATTGTVLAWNPGLASDAGAPEVSAVLVHGGMLFFSGRFTAVNQTLRGGFAAVDVASGGLLPLQLAGLTTVEAMSAVEDTLYLVGRLASFQSAGAALSISSGQQLPWQMPMYPWTANLVATPGRIYASTVDSVYVLDPVTGSLQGPPILTGAWVQTMAAGAGVLAVSFDRFVTTMTHQVATFVAATGQPRTWSLNAASHIEALAVGPEGVAVGGDFQSAGGDYRRNLFALDLRTGRPTTFAPVVNGRVNALAVVGDVLVVGGMFTRVNETDQWGLAALSASAGGIIPWAPLRDGDVHALALAGDALYVGGDFRVMDGYSRPNLAGIQVPSGAATAWLPVPDRPVLALAAGADALFAVGDFAAIAGGPRSGGAAFSLSTGALQSWNPSANGSIHGVAVGSSPAGAVVGVVGAFNILAGQQRLDFGLLDLAGSPLPLTLPFSTHGARAVAALGGQFIVGGRFFDNGRYRGLFAVSTQSGLQAWNPDMGNDPSSEVTLLARYPDLLVAGGSFTVVEGQRVLNLAVFGGGGLGPPTSLRASVSGTRATLGWIAPAGTSPDWYVVEAGTAAGASDLGRFPVLANSISGDLGPGTFYARVRAVVSGVEGQPSSEVVLSIPAAPQPPGAPAALQASVTGNLVSLSWTAAAGNAASYIAEAGTSPGQANIASFDTTVLDTRLTTQAAAGTYYVRIRARNTFGLGPSSNEVVVVVP